MKKLNILKTTLDFILYSTIIASIGIMILSIFNLSNFKLHIGTNNLFRINSKESTITNHSNINTWLQTIHTILYVYCIYLFRKIIIHFCKSDFFNNEVIKLFNRIGKMILTIPFINIIYHFIIGVISFLTNLIYKNKLDFSFESEFDLFNNSFLITISLGFVFIILSDVFKNAKELKEENDLTV